MGGEVVEDSEKDSEEEGNDEGDHSGDLRGPLSVFLLSTRAGGVGINLQSTCGFQSLSYRMTVSADCKLIPTPPALVERRNTDKGPRKSPL